MYARTQRTLHPSAAITSGIVCGLQRRSTSFCLLLAILGSLGIFPSWPSWAEESPASSPALDPVLSENGPASSPTLSPPPSTPAVSDSERIPPAAPDPLASPFSSGFEQPPPAPEVLPPTPTVAAAEVPPALVSPVQLTPVQLTPVQLSPVQVSPVQLSPAQVSPVQISPVQITPAQVPAGAATARATEAPAPLPASSAPALTLAAPSSNPLVTGRDIPAFRTQDASLIVDGKLDEPLWSQAPVLKAFTRYLPVEGGPASSQVSVFVATTADALLIGARVHLASGAVRAHLASREQISVDDQLVILLDPTQSQRTGFSFAVNPYGIQLDATLLATSSFPEWDGMWESAGQVSSDGFSVELRIPFSTLRLSGPATQSWGIGFSLFEAANQTTAVWPETSANRGHRLLQLGLLRDVRCESRAIKTELVPSLVTHFDGMTETSGEARSILDSTRLEGSSALGGDLKLLLQDGSRVSLTLNPDFSQLEADAGQLNYNLRAPLSLTEKRLFFLEGREQLVLPFPLVYTRAINQPVFGARWTGKNGNVSSSVLSVLDRAPIPSLLYFDPALAAANPPAQTGFEDPGTAAGLTTLARVVAEQGSGASVGILLADKRLLDPLTLDSRAANQVVAMDAVLTLAEQYTAKAQLGYSSTTQPEHDALEGSSVGLSLERSAERSYLGMDLLFHSKGFRAETSDMWRTGDFSLMGAGNVKFAPPLPGLTELKPSVQFELLPASAEGKPLEFDLREALTLRLFGHTEVGAQVTQLQEFFNGNAYPQARVQSWFNSLPQKWLSIGGVFWVGDQIHYDPEDTYLGTNLNAYSSVTLRPGSQWAVGLSHNRGVFWRSTADAPELVMDILRLKASYTATSTLSFRWISELNTGSQALTSNALLAWTYRPGTALYLGITEREPILENESMRSLEAFMKISYLFDAPLRGGI